VSRKTVDIPDGWKPPKSREAGRIGFTFLRNIFGRSEPIDELMEQGWRCVGVDEAGRKLYAPPARYSDWNSWP
jgi:hypothetical protein